MVEKFYLASGLKINLEKSHFMASKNVHRSKVEKFSSIATMRSTSNFGNYLGFLILQGRVTRDNFNFIIEKLHSRLAGWKGWLLNKLGRVMLANSVLNSLLSILCKLFGYF